MIGSREKAERYWRSFTHAAKVRRARGVQVSFGYAWALYQQQAGRCALSGIAIDFGAGCSLDRIDSSRGYVEGNVQWVHRDVNMMKLHLPQSYFVLLCLKVASYSHIGEEDAVLLERLVSSGQLNQALSASGRKGGLVAASRKSPDERRANARKAARARWAKHRKEKAATKRTRQPAEVTA